MKKRLLIILIILIFTAGLGILLYPLVSSVVNNINDRSEARQKQMEVEKMDPDVIKDLFADAESYNNSAGHLNNTSLPIGGPGTHSVISAHSAFPSKTLFDYLLDME